MYAECRSVPCEFLVAVARLNVVPRGMGMRMEWPSHPYVRVSAVQDCYAFGEESLLDTVTEMG
jgi:hypothetical protein